MADNEKYRCSHRHPLKDRGFAWVQTASAGWKPVVTCRACDLFDNVVIGEPTEAEAIADWRFPIKPPVAKQLL